MQEVESIIAANADKTRLRKEMAILVAVLIQGIMKEVTAQDGSAADPEERGRV